uniref:Ycf1 protein n=1 Tax=Corydalis semenowii TaxID=2975470 RepID=UPI0023D8991A|nr:Ycf1 protein [Corydalis semenowii]WDA93660.1 Ycf1 protein [Corydalis semenowii]
MFKLFRLATLVRLCMRISNSVVVAGLYYGFLTAGAIGPSYLLLLRVRLMEEGSEKDVSATTGFLMGQLIMFISIYYAPLHLALGRPHTITILSLLYFMFSFVWRNDKDFFDSVATTRNGMRNLGTQYVFLTNLIFPLFNHFVFPSSTLPRLISIYMFRCNNNKMLFLTSSFVGWFIGHILCMKGFELVLFWIRKNHSIRLNKYRRNSLERIFTILVFLCFVYYLGRIPSPIRIEDKKKKRKKTSATAERGQSEDETDVEIDTTSKPGQERSAKEDPSLFSEDSDNLDEELKEKKDFFCSEKPLVTYLFDYKRWNRPWRYLKTDEFKKKALRNEMSDYFFYTCRSDGKQRISFTYPPSLSTFFEMIERKGFLYTPEKIPSDELYNHWIYINEQKRNSLSNELFHRIDALERGSLDLDVLEKRIRLCNDETAQECLPKRYDCFLNGPSRGTTKLPPSIEKEDEDENDNEKEKEKENEKEKKKEKEKENEKEKDYLITPTGDSKEKVWINKFHDTLFSDYEEFEQKLDTFEEKSLLSDQGKMDSENQVQYFFGASTTEPKDQTSQKNTKGGLDLKKKKRPLKEIEKKVARWKYKLINDSKEETTLEEEDPDLAAIVSRDFKAVFIFDWQDYFTKLGKANEYDDKEKDTQDILARYSKQSNFNRDLIKGSVRAQRRKTVTWKLFETILHSPLFVDRIDTIFSPILQIRNPIFRIFRNWMGKGGEVKTWDYEEDEAQEREDEAQEREDETQERENETQEREDEAQEREDEAQERERAEEERLERVELWDSIPLGHAIRGYLLLGHSILRKKIVLPSLIIAKNFSLIFLFPFQFRNKFSQWYKDWDEDWKAWGREIHVNCTHNGVSISEKEFPQDWLTDGIQIKILFPFRLRYSFQLRPHHKQKDPMQKKRKKAKFSFLTTWGMETERPFGAHLEEPHPLEPIYKEFEKRIREAKNKCFLLLNKCFLLLKKMLKKKAKRILDPFIKIKELAKGNRNKKIGLREGYELSETQHEKNFIISNQIFDDDESSSRIQSMDWTKSSLTEQKIKDLSARTNTIRNQIEKITNDKKTKFLIPDINLSPSEASFAEKRLDSSKNLWQIVKRRSVRLIRKGRFFLAFFIESIFFQSLIYISRVNVQTFLELKTKIIDTYSYKQTNQERIDENTIHWISTIKNIKKQFSNSNIGDKNSKNFLGIVSLSQAYVFYKLSQSPGIHKYPLKSVLQYSRTSLFLKDRIKNFFGTQGIFHSESRYKEHGNAEMNEWKNWLSGHYQYDLSQTRLAKFMSQKWRNRINQSCKVQNIDSLSLDSYEKNQLILFDKQKEKAASLSVKTKNDKLKKHYKYDLLSHKYINSEERKDFSIYGLPLQGNEGRGIPSKYITYKPDFFSIRRYIRKNPDRKYLDWQIICFRKTRHIEAWINKKNKIATHYSPIINTIDKKDLFYHAIHKQVNSSKNNTKNKKNNTKNKKNNTKNKKNNTKNKKNNTKNKKNNTKNKKNNPFDWMGMNKARLTQTQRSKKSIYEKYRRKPWIIPIKLLLFEFNNNQNIRDIGENKNTKEKEKKDLELENKNQEEKKQPGQGKPRSNQPNQGKPKSNQPNQGKLKSNQPNQQQDVKQESGGANIEKYKKKTQEKKPWKPTTDLDIFLKNKSYVDFRLNWSDFFEENVITTINISTFLLRMKNPIEMALSFFRRKEMPLASLMYRNPKLIQPELTLESAPELTLESEPERTRESPLELTLETELTLESEPELTLESEPDPTLESELKPTLESEPKSPIRFPKALIRGELLIKLVPMPRKWDGPLIMYQTIAISLIHKNKHPIHINRKYQEKEKRNVDRNDFSEVITKQEKMVKNIAENHYDLLVPEKISSPRRRRELRILICLNYGKKNMDGVGKKKVFCNKNNVRNCDPLLTNSKDLDIETNQFIKLKFFLWPNYRLEDLACMNRYWFDTSNGSRFSMLRIRMYPPLKIR